MQVGLFTRPYVERFCEQEDLTGKPVNVEQLLSEMDEIAERLPKTSSCSAGSGARELDSFVTVLCSCMEICEEYLAEMDARKEDARLKRSHPTPAPIVDYCGRHAEPWKTHSYATWLDRHLQLWRMMVRCKDHLIHDQPTYSKSVSDTEAARACKPDGSQRLMDLCYILSCNILQCAYAVANSAMRQSYIAYMPPQSIRDAELLLSRPSVTQPVNFEAMPETMLMDHIYHLLSSWNELMYSVELRNYVVLLEMRASQLITCAQSSLDSDSPAHRIELDKPKSGELEADAMIRARFGISTKAIGLYMAAFLGMYERFEFAIKFNLAGGPPQYRDLPPPYDRCRFRNSDPEELANAESQTERVRLYERVKGWIVDQVNTEQTTIPSGFIRKFYAEESLWPGEAMMYQMDPKKGAMRAGHSVVALSVIRQFRAADSTDVVVHPLLKAKRGLQYTPIVEASVTPTAVIIKRELVPIPSSNPAGKESCLLRMALHEFISNQVSKIVGDAIEWDRWVVNWEHIKYQYSYISRKDLPIGNDRHSASFIHGGGEASLGGEDSMDGISDNRDLRAYPYIVQLFNHWNLVFRGRVYWVDSYVEAFAMWLRILEVHYDRKLGSVDVSPLLDAIFDDQKEARMMQQRLKKAGSRAAFAVGV